MFQDGMFNKCVFIIQAEYDSMRHEKRKRSHENVLPSKDVFIVGLVVIPDADIGSGDPRFYEFDLDLETRPRGATVPKEVLTQTLSWQVGKWDS